jgi:hypothetical protein
MGVAQLEEQRSPKPQVAGSSPATRAKPNRKKPRSAVTTQAKKGGAAGQGWANLMQAFRIFSARLFP